MPDSDPPKTGDTLPGVASGIDDVLRLLFEMRGQIRGVEDALEDMHAHHEVRLKRLERITDDHGARIADIEARLAAEAANGLAD